LLQIIWLFVPSGADAAVEPLNNAAPFQTVNVNLSPSSSGKDQVTATATPQPAFTTSGFVAATFFPPHNEYDPNFGLPLGDLVTARYALTSDVTVFHKSGWFGRLFLFMPLGDSRPQTDYNYSADPILLEFQPSLGFRFTRNLDLRITYSQMFDLGGFKSEDEYQPWFGPSLRFGTDRPQINAWNIAWVSGFVEGFIFVPGFEYPATPGASADGLPVIRFRRDQIVNARYAIELNGKIQAKWKYIDRLFFFAAPKFFFGKAGVDDHSSWSAAPLTVAVELGAGVQLTQHVELRGTHTEFRDLGGSPEGLERLYANGISLRWSW
jgi:hypothetical protein